MVGAGESATTSRRLETGVVRVGAARRGALKAGRGHGQVAWREGSKRPAPHTALLLLSAPAFALASCSNAAGLSLRDSFSLGTCARSTTPPARLATRRCKSSQAGPASVTRRTSTWEADALYTDVAMLEPSPPVIPCSPVWISPRIEDPSRPAARAVGQR